MRGGLFAWIGWTADGENPFIEISAFWTRCIADGSVVRIRAAAQHGENCQLHGVLYNNRQGGERFSYLIGHFMPETGLQEGFETLQISPQTYAIFSTGLYNDGESGIHQLWKRIWGEWFPTCTYDNVDGPEFEMTYDRGNGKYEMEVWIPVVKKQEA
ncbi:GyrI-like domain-containing protein [Paenibacillus sp. D51F]